MPGLVEELQRAATDPSVSIGDLLRKAKLVASKLGQTKTALWIDAELSGDFDGLEFPEYRRVPVRAMHYHPMHGTYPLVTTNARMNEVINEAVFLPRPAREIEQFANGADDQIFISVPPKAVESLRKILSEVYDIRHLTSRAAFAGILDGIRTRVLDWALELENNGVHGEGMSFSPEEKHRASSIVVNMSGGNFAGVVGESHGVGAQHVSQQVGQVIERAHDLARRLLDESRELPEDDRTIIAAAVEAVNAASDESGLRKALKFTKSAVAKITGFAAKAATEHEIGELLDMLPM
jgi:hypothetical protein